MANRRFHEQLFLNSGYDLHSIKVFIQTEIMNSLKTPEEIIASLTSESEAKLTDRC